MKNTVGTLFENIYRRTRDGTAVETLLIRWNGDLIVGILKNADGTYQIETKRGGWSQRMHSSVELQNLTF